MTIPWPCAGRITASNPAIDKKSCGWPHRSSFAGFLSTSCPTASIASGTTACWPTRPAKQTLGISAPCFASSRLNRWPRRKQSQRSHHSPCASHVPAVAAPCVSARSSGAGKNRCRAHHQGSRPHDTSLVSRHGKLPTALRRLGPNGVWLFISSVTRGGNDTETHSFFGIPSRPHERIGHHAQLQPQH